MITGCAVFIGSHVVSFLSSKYPDYRIVVLDKMDYCSSRRNLEGSRATLIRGDIMSIDIVSHILKTENIDTVMHFAAQTHVDNSFGNSLEFTRNNVVGTHVLLEACRLWGNVRRFINVSTDEVYGESSVDATKGLGESTSLNPTNPYAAAKAGAEFIAMSYAASYGMPIITTRGNNVYGPNQFPEKLIPKCVSLLAADKPISVHGDGRAIRSFLHVLDVTSAFDIILHRGKVGSVYNIGTTAERSVIDVVNDIIREMGRTEDPNTLEHVRDRTFNDRRYFISSNNLEDLGWKQQIPWEVGLRSTIDWYMNPINTDGRWDRSDHVRALLTHPNK
jgi:UDP-glucose 4,6-dehydratase